MYSYSSSLDSWLSKSSLPTASVDSTNVITNSAEQTKMDSCYYEGIVLDAWEDTRGGIRYSVTDQVTGAFFVADTELSSSGDTPRCLIIDNNLCVLFGDSTNIKMAYVSSTDPTSISTTTVQTDLHTDHLLSTVGIGAKGIVFYKTTTANQARFLEIDKLGTVLKQPVLTATIIDTLDLNYYTSNGDVKFHIAYKETASLVKSGIYSENFTQLVAPTAIDSTASADISKITMHRTSSTIAIVTGKQYGI